MTAKELYIQSKQLLENSGAEAPGYDTQLLIEKCFGMTHQDIIIKGDCTLPADKLKIFSTLLNKRANGEPLQYLLEEWEFFGLPFKVGTGVLIPRSDTEVLVQTVLDNLDESVNYRIADLCSGSGAIGIALASNLPCSTITLIEKSVDAFDFLKKNIILNNIVNCKSVNADIFDCCNDFCNGFFDIIVSNPPYIESKIISTLQKEVQHEPIMALDGGDDGLFFYKSIVKKWGCKLRTGGLLAFEIGETQAKQVSSIMATNGFTDITVVKDYNQLDRVVYGVYSNG